MLYANSPAVQQRVDAYVRKPSLCPAPLPGEAPARTMATLEKARLSGLPLYRVTLVNAAIRELSTTDPED